MSKPLATSGAVDGVALNKHSSRTNLPMIRVDVLVVIDGLEIDTLRL